MNMRKIFVLMMSALLMASFVSCGSNEPMDSLPVGLQLYSLRGDMQKDFRGTLQKVKDMGYEGVEFSGFFGNTPEQVKAMCDEIGLVPVSAHIPLDEMLADIDRVIADCKTLGCEYIVLPYVTEERRPGGEFFMQMMDEIRFIGEKVRDAGLVLLYHNHDFEFRKLESGEYGLDFIFRTIPAELLQCELDECRIAYAGLDPVEYLKKYDGRSPIVHLKDYYVDNERNMALEFRPLGCGVQDVPALVKTSEEVGCRWLMVEQDQPSLNKTPIECAAMSIDYLKKILGNEL